MDIHSKYTKRLKEQLSQAKGENRWLEFKSNNLEAEKMGSYLSALSNGACLDHQDYAYLYFGIDDETMEIKGTSFDIQKKKAKGNQDLELFLRQNICPKINFTVEEFFYDGVKRLVVVKIPAAVGEPTLFLGKPYGRVDSSVTEISRYSDWLRIIYNSHVDWTAEHVPDATLDDLDKDAVNLARIGFAQRNPDYAEEMKAWSDEVFLDRAGLTRDGEIIRTTLLLLGKKESAYKLGHTAQLVWKLIGGPQEAGDIYTIPFIKSSSALMQRIRNYRIKIYPQTSLIPAEVWKYDSRSILEALHNCIAHQDYTMDERIIVTEDDNKLTFENAGDFFTGDYRQYIYGKKTPKKYRNPCLTMAMVNVKMIDTKGYGIHKLFERQRERFLPMPDYDVTDDTHVVMHLPGTIIDENYSVMLMNYEEISLEEAVLLDLVQKGKPISDDAIKRLRKKHYIEGRKPNLYVAKQLAQATGTEVEYSKHKGLESKSCEAFLIDALRDHATLNRQQIDGLLWNLLSDQLSDQQKKSKIGYILRILREKGKISNETRGPISEYSLVKE